jgi:hypothetical protein
MFVRVQLTNRVILTLLATISIPFLFYNVDASSKSPYESGYDHAQDDCGLDTDDRYINQPGKGPSQHTRAFMNGYNDGIADCDNGNDDSDSDSNGGGGGSLEDDIRDACMDTLNWSADRCDSLINAGKTFIICRAINAVGIPTPC